MTKQQIIDRATLLSNKIRQRRKELSNKKEALLLYNNLIKSTIYILNEINLSLRGCNNIERCAILINEAENEYNIYIW